MRRTHTIYRTMELGFALLVCATTTAAADTTGDSTSTPGPDRQRELIRLLKQDCGACHGLYLTGGLGPALRPRDLYGKPAESLSEVILKGRPGTPMPGWQAFLSAAEAGWMAEALLKGLPDDR